MSLKILVFAPHEGDHIYPWLRAQMHQHQLTVLSFHYDKPRTDQVHFIHLKRYTGTRLDFILNIGTIFRELSRLNPDLIHVHYLSSYGLIAALFPSRYPKLLSIWGSDINKYYNSSLMGKLCRWALSKYQMINSPSEDIKKKLIAWGYPENQIATFQYGIDFSELKMRTEKLPGEGVQFLSPRDWAPLYRIEKIIEGFALFAKQDSTAVLHLTGRGGVERKAELESKIQDLGLNSRIILHGFMEWHVYVQFLASCDVIVSIPTMDGMPLSLLEANYIGLHPIVSKVPANLEWLKNGVAHFVQGDDASEIAQAMMEAKKQCFDFQALQKNRNLVLQNGDRQKNMKKLSEIYQMMANR